MFTSFSTALSALSAFSTAIDVVGNNLANLNTTGFKTSAVTFHDLVTQSLGLGETQVGLGVARPLTLRQFNQGALQSSSGVLDAAIQGDGFFVLRDASGATLVECARTLKEAGAVAVYAAVVAVANINRADISQHPAVNRHHVSAAAAAADVQLPTPQIHRAVVLDRQV